MVNNEKYTKFLKSIIACVSHGDYCAAKELSNLELDKMKNNEQRTRMCINNPMYNKEIAKKSGEKHKRKVSINGIVYDGLVDAAKELNVAEYTVLNWCKRGYDTDGNPCRYNDEEQKEYNYKIFIWGD